ncbi:MAG: purine phosphoribosyltransferase family protein [Methanosarcinales archaeon]|nr:MAG: purine phosphoribosyltransferase family protein [Methanosarcinales archaeon]
MLDILKASLKGVPIVKKGDYHYFVHPITDGVPELQPSLIEEITSYIAKNAETNVDKIVTIEAMGIHIGTALSLKTGIPMVIIRKRMYGLPGEIAVHQATGYSKGELYLNGIHKGDKVLIVDDVISTGGTMRATIEALKIAGAEIKDIFVVFSRGNGIEELMKMGYNARALIDVDVSEGKVIIKRSADE